VALNNQLLDQLCQGQQRAAWSTAASIAALAHHSSKAVAVMTGAISAVLQSPARAFQAEEDEEASKLAEQLSQGKAGCQTATQVLAFASRLSAGAHAHGNDTQLG
jgi:hypothetical protein